MTNKHDHSHKGVDSVSCFVLTVSDTRNHETDTGGKAVRDLLTEAGHVVVDSRIVPDDNDEIRKSILDALSSEAHVVIVTGGTGVSGRDTTIDAVAPFMDIELEGFGEIFRQLSYEQIGARAILSRAIGGITPERKALFCLPGSEKAVRLGMEKLVLPILGHLIWELNR